MLRHQVKPLLLQNLLKPVKVFLHERCCGVYICMPSSGRDRRHTQDPPCWSMVKLSGQYSPLTTWQRRSPSQSVQVALSAPDSERSEVLVLERASLEWQSFRLHRCLVSLETGNLRTWLDGGWSVPSSVWTRAALGPFWPSSSTCVSSLAWAVELHPLLHLPLPSLNSVSLQTPSLLTLYWSVVASLVGQPSR